MIPISCKQVTVEREHKVKQSVLDAFADYTEEQDQQVNEAAQNHTRKKVLPDPGRYQCTFHDYDAFSFEDKETGETVRAIKLLFRVEEGEKAGLIMERTFWSNEYDRAAFFDSVTILTGTAVTAVLPGLQALDGALGKACVCKVSKGVSKKTGNAWESLNLVG